MVATLVLQLPSEHTGGDLVVFRGRDTQYRYDFGKASGMAPYLPHYAVHYADAEHALEEVTSGYRLVLVYSVCLPQEMQDDRPLRPLNEELGDAIARMGGHDSFALLFAHEYTEQSITSRGVNALKGVDRARFHALLQANARVVTDKLRFFLPKLCLDLDYFDDGGYWDERERHESVVWYSASGASCSSPVSGDDLNFLNPGEESLDELWTVTGSSTFEGYLGNEGATRSTTYSRFALVARRVQQAPKRQQQGTGGGQKQARLR